MRVGDLALVIGTLGAFVLAVEARGRIHIAPEEIAPPEVALITCPMRHPDFATVLQAAFIGDGTLIVEQQTRTRVRHIKDC